MASDAAALVGQCVAGGPHTELSFEQLARKLNVAADRPHLLDPHLLSLAAPVLAVLQGSEREPLERGARVLYLLSKVRGVAPVAKLLPHEMGWVGRVAKRLGEGGWAWETSYVLLVWLGELALMPIGLSRIVDDVSELVELGKTHLMSPGKPSAAAATLLARLLTRPDCTGGLAPFVEWCLGGVAGNDNDLALLSVLATTLQTGPREVLLPLAPRMFVGLAGLTMAGSSVLRRKMLLKVIQRIGLVYLAPRLAPWRYQRGNRLLLTGLASKTPISQPEPAAASAKGRQETWIVPREVDRVVHVLLEGLKDRDTVVRWTAAKGIGRVTERIPADFAEEVVEAVMELCNPAEEESAWHGSCLALAELARRGLLLPEALGRALPAVLEALRYDVKQGARTVGSQVRDGACYVLWASARAYAPAVLAPFTVTIAGALLECASLDREINCRRAASAAIQEHVGRVGLMPHGLDLISVTDYFKLGSLRTSFVEVAKAIASYPEYGPWFVETVVERKLGHWDVAVRENAALLFGEMAALDSCRDAVVRALPRLRTMCVHPTCVEARHGALLAIAYAVGEVCKVDGVCVDVATIVPELDAARLFRGKGGEILRVAACVLVEHLAKARVELKLDIERLVPHLMGRPDSGKTGAKRHKEFLDECLRNASDAVQSAAAIALGVFCASYLSHLEAKVRGAIVAAYCAHLSAAPQQQVPSYTRGAAMALGALPEQLFDEPSRAQNLQCLADAVRVSPDAETRKIAVASLRGGSAASVEALLVALRDYAIDERGDVGSWSREAACVKLPLLLDSCWSSKDCEEACAALAEIVAGRMEQLREPAVAALKCLVAFCKPGLDDLAVVLKDESNGSVWNSSCRLLLVSSERVRQCTFLSLCVSSGLRTPDAVARETLLRFLSGKVGLLCRLLWREDVPQLLRQYARDDRVISHLIACVDCLVRNGCFDDFIADGCAADAVRGECWAAFANSSSVPLLCVGIDLMCALLRFANATVAPLVVLLGHRYPRVRQHCCLQLQLQLSLIESLCPDETCRSQVLAALLEGALQDSDVDVSGRVRVILRMPAVAVATDTAIEDEI